MSSKDTCKNKKCKDCIHAYKEYPYDSEGKFFYCGLHSFGTVNADFYCKDFEYEKKDSDE